MSTSIQKRRMLADLLYERTIDKKLKWEESGAGVAKIELGPILVFISKTTNMNFEEMYEIHVYQEGEQKDQFTDEDLGPANVPTGVHGVSNYFRLCEALYDTALRQTTGADDALDIALTHLLAGD